MRTLARYVAMQTPGWTVAAVVCWTLWRYEVVAAVDAGVLLAAWVAKDLVLYPWLRRAFEPGRDVLAAMIGREGTVCAALDPVGQVRIGSELWRARLARGSERAMPGDAVEIEAVEGLTLVVRTR